MTVDMKTRRMIVRLDKQHMTHGSIAKAAQISRRTVINILDEYKLTGDLTPKPILGRPRKLNQTEERKGGFSRKCAPSASQGRTSWKKSGDEAAADLRRPERANEFR